MSTKKRLKNHDFRGFGRGASNLILRVNRRFWGIRKWGRGDNCKGWISRAGTGEGILEQKWQNIGFGKPGTGISLDLQV
ncbi:hypothetical protein UR09_04080 [Candidatus Nitromaritima sp. SCGC AAA799-A02]|nr:hypothetical protein UR09_04080 [Candidatus Nitromaritima sp. SCGC AAA799-A02]